MAGNSKREIIQIESTAKTGYRYSVTKNKICVTISLDIKFIGSSRIGDEIIGNVNIQKQTKSLVFATCDLICKKKTIASASGVWKKINKIY